MTRNETAVLVALGLGLTPFAAAYGVAGVAAGLSETTTIIISVFVYAGASQFSALGVLAAGGSPLLALVTLYLVNLRFIPVGMAMPRTVAPTWPQRLLGAQFLVDPMVAIVRITGERRQNRFFWVIGLLLYTLWVLGTVLGVAAGNVIPDPDLLGLDAALPCVFIGLLVTWWRHPPSRRAMLGGAAVTTGAFLVAPASVAVPLGILGAVLGLPRRSDASDEASANSEEQP